MERTLSLIADMNRTEPLVQFAWNGEQPRLAYSLLLFQVLRSNAVIEIVVKSKSRKCSFASQT